jgi:hypothetical protein
MGHNDAPSGRLNPEAAYRPNPGLPIVRPGGRPPSGHIWCFQLLSFLNTVCLTVALA